MALFSLPLLLPWWDISIVCRLSVVLQGVLFMNGPPCWLGYLDEWV
jgi:hypothetical protein